MADRHGRVTRWYTITNYRIDKMTVDGKKTEEREDIDGLSAVEIEAVERMRLQRKNEILVSVKILSRERVLYCMTKDEFRSLGTVLDREPALDI